MKKCSKSAFASCFTPQTKTHLKELHFSYIFQKGKKKGGWGWDLALIRMSLIFKLQIIKWVTPHVNRLAGTILANAKFSSLSSGETATGLSAFAVLMFLLIFSSLYRIRCCTQPELSPLHKPLTSLM